MFRGTLGDQWPEIGDQLCHRWRKLSRDDVRVPRGSAEYLVGVLQTRYGISRRDALLEVFEFECDLQLTNGRPLTAY